MDYYGYDPNQYDYTYADQWGYEEEEEETQSQKLKKEQEMIEEIESNRLYLKKVRKRCVQEDFADLEKTQMFLFEFLVESLEVNTQSELGLVPETDEPTELVTKVQFLDIPCLEIREKGERIEGSDSQLGQNEYFETVGNAGLEDAVEPGKTGVEKVESSGESVKKEEEGSEDESIVHDTRWENSSGKSLLFAKTAWEIIHKLSHSPLKVQVSMCTVPAKEEDDLIYAEIYNDEWGEGEEEGAENKETDVKEEVKVVKEPMCEPLGYAQIRLPDHFSLSVLQSCKPGVILPVSCIHRDVCVLKNVFGAKKGEMQVFVRLSCFGTVISTSFQSTGQNRNYVFKPSPQPECGKKEEPDESRDTLLKPILAEEDVAIGISVMKDDDVFRKPVVWKSGPQPAEEPEDFVSKFNRFKDYTLRRPRPSDTDLCRDAISGGKKCKDGKTFCDWHDLVGKEIKNSPEKNCGCLERTDVIKAPTTTEGRYEGDDKRDQRRSTERRYEEGGKRDQRHLSPEELYKQAMRNPSRMEKLRILSPKVMETPQVPVKGLGIPCEPKDCNCDCGKIRDTLATNPMMKPTWQVK